MRFGKKQGRTVVTQPRFHGLDWFPAIGAPDNTYNKVHEEEKKHRQKIKINSITVQEWVGVPGNDDASTLSPIDKEGNFNCLRVKAAAVLKAFPEIPARTCGT
jgi:hypothetical protein